jgi:hypothetical protein
MAGTREHECMEGRGQPKGEWTVGVLRGALGSVLEQKALCPCCGAWGQHTALQGPATCRPGQLLQESGVPWRASKRAILSSQKPHFLYHPPPQSSFHLFQCEQLPSSSDYTRDLALGKNKIKSTALLRG